MKKYPISLLALGLIGSAASSSVFAAPGSSPTLSPPEPSFPPLQLINLSAARPMPLRPPKHTYSKGRGR